MPQWDSQTVHLLLVILRLVVDDVEEAELVHTLGGGDDAKPVTELLLLEELLGAVNHPLANMLADNIGDKTYRYFR